MKSLALFAVAALAVALFAIPAEAQCRNVQQFFAPGVAAPTCGQAALAAPVYQQQAFAAPMYAAPVQQFAAPVYQQQFAAPAFAGGYGGFVGGSQAFFDVEFARRGRGRRGRGGRAFVGGGFAAPPVVATAPIAAVPVPVAPRRGGFKLGLININ